MAKLDIAAMMELQQKLQEQYKEEWGGLYLEKGRDQLLWMIAEAGEVAQVIKKHGDQAIMSDPEVRHHFIEEICDVLMYMNDVLLCYEVKPEELEQIYLEKNEYNQHRWEHKGR